MYNIEPTFLTRRMRMHRIHIGVMCLLMLMIFGVSLEASGQDKDGGEQKI